MQIEWFGEDGVSPWPFCMVEGVETEWTEWRRAAVMLLGEPNRVKEAWSTGPVILRQVQGPGTGQWSFGIRQQAALNVLPGLFGDRRTTW